MAVDNSLWTNTSLSGLTEAEVTQRRAQGLGNSALPPTGRTYAQIVRENVFTFINIVIFVLAVALVLVGRASDAVVSVGVISPISPSAWCRKSAPSACSIRSRCSHARRRWSSVTGRTACRPKNWLWVTC